MDTAGFLCLVGSGGGLRPEEQETMSLLRAPGGPGTQACPETVGSAGGESPMEVELRPL